MINVFNRKLLFRDTNAEAAADVWSALRKDGIKYEVVTKTQSSSVRRMFTQKKDMMNMSGIPASWKQHSADYIYNIYVNKKDYDAAKKTCNL